MAAAPDGSGGVQLTRGIHSGLSVSNNRLVSIMATPHAPPEIQVIDAETRSATTLAYSGLAGRATDGCEQLELDAPDGFAVKARLYHASARGGEKAPMLVWIHGGPTGQSSATHHARVHYFVERGWSVLVPDYRGSSGHGRKYMQALNGAWGEADVQDVAACIQGVAEGSFDIDSQKIALYGGSAGGFTALHVMARYPELSAAGVVMYPVCDLLDFGESTWRFEAHYLETLIGPLPGAHDEYIRRSPITHAAKIKAPLLVMHGDSDIVVPSAQSDALVDRLRKSGATVEYKVYEGEGHSWRKPTTVIDELQRVESFLRRHVLHLGATTEESK